jgi:hypothetical protein
MTAALTNSTLIAPSGINCDVCRAHIRSATLVPDVEQTMSANPKHVSYARSRPATREPLEAISVSVALGFPAGC